MITLKYFKGLVLSGDARLPNSVWDKSLKSYKALAMHYSDWLAFLSASRTPFEDRVMEEVPHGDMRMHILPRGYQVEALDAWLGAGMRGTVVLPTGSGKTILGMLAIHEANSSAIVIVPTIDLMEQWRARLGKAFSVDVGAYGGGENKLGQLTVATYDTAYLRVEELGNRFRLVIFDEVHHLPSPGYSQVAELFASRYRLGLTATYEREDGLHSELARLVGPKVFERRVGDMAGTHLSPFKIERVHVALSPEEDAEYRKNIAAYRSFLASRNLQVRSPEDLRRLIMRSGRDRAARDALLAKNRASSIALNSSSKIDAMRGVLASNPGHKTIIFTQHNSLVYRLSRLFLMPAITHSTPKDERAEVLQRFREGTYRAIVTSKVLDEGIDVPDASLGIILSGTGSKREFVQRLGRILRKVEGKEARLVEIVTRSTMETGVSSRRRGDL